MHSKFCLQSTRAEVIIERIRPYTMHANLLSHAWTVPKRSDLAARAHGYPPSIPPDVLSASTKDKALKLTRSHIRVLPHTEE